MDKQSETKKIVTFDDTVLEKLRVRLPAKSMVC